MTNEVLPSSRQFSASSFLPLNFEQLPVAMTGDPRQYRNVVFTGNSPARFVV